MGRDHEWKLTEYAQFRKDKWSVSNYVTSLNVSMFLMALKKLDQEGKTKEKMELIEYYKSQLNSLMIVDYVEILNLKMEEFEMGKVSNGTAGN